MAIVVAIENIFNGIVGIWFAVRSMFALLAGWVVPSVEVNIIGDKKI